VAGYSASNSENGGTRESASFSCRRKRSGWLQLEQQLKQRTATATATAAQRLRGWEWIPRITATATDYCNSNSRGACGASREAAKGAKGSCWRKSGWPLMRFSCFCLTATAGHLRRQGAKSAEVLLEWTDRCRIPGLDCFLFNCNGRSNCRSNGLTVSAAATACASLPASCGSTIHSTAPRCAAVPVPQFSSALSTDSRFSVSQLLLQLQLQ
jgi:hypothetical protein